MILPTFARVVCERCLGKYYKRELGLRFPLGISQYRYMMGKLEGKKQRSQAINDRLSVLQCKIISTKKGGGGGGRGRRE